MKVVSNAVYVKVNIYSDTLLNIKIKLNNKKKFKAIYRVLENNKVEVKNIIISSIITLSIIAFGISRKKLIK